MMNKIEVTSCRTIDIVIYPEFKSFEAIGPMTVFTYANKHLEAQEKEPGYMVRILSTKVGPVISDTLMSLNASHALSESTPSHSVMVVGAHEIERIVEEQPEIVEWTKKVAPNVERFAALCSGAFFCCRRLTKWPTGNHPLADGGSSAAEISRGAGRHRFHLHTSR
ncbi:hypothetical protein QZH47_07955 [Pseudomonas corrugata]